MMARRGTSLVEVMVVIVLLGIVGSLTVQLLLTLFHADAWQQEQSAADYALGQLELALRDDVHAAQQAEIDGDRLVLSLSNQERAVYTATPQAITSERLRVTQDEELVLKRDRFALPRGLALTWRKETEDEIAWLFVELRPHDASSPDARKKPRVLREAHFQIRIGRGQAAEGGSP
jgi:prepilin-type N-terminal cleavage/methylation domain-containing protein